MIPRSFWLILLAILAWGLFHSILASLKVKAKVRQWVGTLADRWYRLAYNLIAIITLIPILPLPFLLPDKGIYQLRLPFMLLTSAIQIVAIVVLIIGVKQTGVFSFLGVRQLYAPQDASPPSLVTTGLYTYVRHPLYTAGLVIIWLIPSLSWNLLAINLGITLYILIGAYYEERKLLSEYGPIYADYSKQTPMLIPGLRVLFHKRSS